MSDIAAFLLARFDEAGERVRELLRWSERAELELQDPRYLGKRIPGWHAWPDVSAELHAALRDIEAKRKIVELISERGKRAKAIPVRGCHMVTIRITVRATASTTSRTSSFASWPSRTAITRTTTKDGDHD